MKRAFDLVVSAIMGLVLLPFILVLVAVIRTSSEGPGLFAQTRVGKHERPFVCYKLRTMYIGTGDRPSHETRTSAVTPLGHVLRKTKLDELPQLWNVFRGEMSFVGPRPCLPTQVELVRLRREKGVYKVRPGITGVAQVLGVDMSDPAKLAELDASYVATMSFTGDLGLIFKTLAGSGQGDRTQRG